MNSELNQVRHPYRIYFFWGLVYSLIIAVVVLLLFWAAGRIRTHTLPEGSISLKIPYSKYLVGEPITFTLKNNYNSSIYVVNNCPSEPLEVYKLENEEWVRQHDRVSIKQCDDDSRQISVPAKGVVNGSFAAWKNLFSTPGKYRIVAYVEYYNQLPYQDIEIIEKPSVQPTSNAANANSNSSSSTEESEEQESTQTQNNTGRQTKTTSTASGSIKVQYDAINVYVISVTPASGCGYEGGRSGREVEVTFKCAGGETQVQLRVVNGQLATKIETGDD